MLLSLLTACAVQFDSAPIETTTVAPVTKAPVTEAPETTTAKETETTEETTTAATTEEPREPQVTVPVDTAVYAETTKTPKVTAKVNVSSDLVCIAGRCEQKSEIIIRGGKSETRFYAYNIYFIGTTWIFGSGVTELYVSAQVEGKAESEAVKVSMKYTASLTSLRDDAFEVIVGSDSQGHFITAINDYVGNNLVSDAQCEALTKTIKQRVEYLKNDYGAELIYLIVPDSATLFPETVPTEYKRATSTRSAQFIKAVEAGGATVINTTDTLIAHKSDGLKLFHKTDSHWTEYGAWIAYCQLFDYISQKFPSAAPRTFDEMGFYIKDVNGGDMPYYLTLDCSDVREVAVLANPTFCKSTLKFTSEDDLLMNHNTTPKAATLTTGDESLPNAVVFRDSYGIAMYDMLADRFNVTEYAAMWSYGLDKDLVKKNNPDYVIYIVAERDLGECFN